MRRFNLVRRVDESGVSGTGLVAEGIEFGDGTVAMRWKSREHHSTSLWDSIDDLIAIHGHGGMTTVGWIDPPEPMFEASPQPPRQRRASR
jgi:hypothetical protein